MDQKGISRREVLQLGAVAGALWTCSGCAMVGSRKPDVLARQEKGVLGVDEVDSAKLHERETSLLVGLAGDSDKILVIHARDGGLYAVSSRCTHLGCDVGYEKNVDRIVCPCHGSEFALDGGRVKGPAKRPLRRYDVTLDEDRVVIDLSSGSR
jgi:Rieske Fe-S protein